MKLKQFREAAKMTQGEVAARLHITRSTVAHWERGRNGPSKRILPRVAELYRCSVEDLLDSNADSEQSPTAAGT